MSFAQSVITPALQDAIQSRDNSQFEVLVYLNEQVNLYQFDQQMRNQRADKNQRVKSIQHQLKSLAGQSQQEFRSQLVELTRTRGVNIHWKADFWIVNAVLVETDANGVNALAALSLVEKMDINTPRYLVNASKVVEGKAAKSEGGVETGITAINAHELWKLGYTGRNLLFLSIDTGVHHDHPAIKDRYLGNHKPIEQSWYALRHPLPVDNANSSHGTHTTGTVLGLAPETNDTIGIAYNSYWIAADPVASTAAEILDPVDFLMVYQWALNPDGNDATTSDVPDVINNSWGYDFELAAEFDACNLQEAQALMVIENAGILNPFSAGNEGPDASTVGFPAMMAFDEMNTFSVGALNANTAGFPIAGFSSHGPTTCTEVPGSISIKPEVSAPGVDVRSCTGHDGYGYLSGTSMACPHVAGAMLLLREAFPTVSNQDIKVALFETATDLGDEGEDNVYGNGMIDVLAAYNHLALTNTPATPVSNDYDVTSQLLVQNDVDHFLTINSAPTVQLKISNLGSQDIDTVIYTVLMNNQSVIDAQYNDGIASGESVTIDLDIESSFVDGKNTINVITSLKDAGLSELDMYNNDDIVNIFKIGEGEFPYSDNFESFDDGLTENTYFINTDDHDRHWEVRNIEVDEQSNKAMVMQFLNYRPRDGQLDAFYTPIVTLPDTEEQLNLSVDYAYKTRLSTIYKDSLYVIVHNLDDTQVTPDTLFRDGTEGLATVEGLSSSKLFIPQSDEDWDTLNVDLSAYKGKMIMVEFLGENDNGSTLYIDNLRMYTGFPDAIESIESSNITIYPNPTNGIIHISHDLNSKSQLMVVDLNGSVVYQQNLAKDQNTIDCDLSNLSSGVYFLKLMNENNISVKRIILQ